MPANADFTLSGITLAAQQLRKRRRYFCGSGKINFPKRRFSVAACKLLPYGESHWDSSCSSISAGLLEKVDARHKLHNTNS